MRAKEINEANNYNNLLEILAKLEHEQWAHWTKYMLDNLTEENIKRWKTQIDTPYIELSEKEKDFDKEWAQKVINLFNYYY